MNSHLTSVLSTGVAFAAAGVIVAGPVAAPPPDVAIRADDRAVGMLASPNRLLAAFIEAAEDFVPGRQFERAAQGTEALIEDFGVALDQVSGRLGTTVQDTPEALRTFFAGLATGDHRELGYGTTTGLTLFQQLVQPFVDAVGQNVPQDVEDALDDAWTQFRAGLARLSALLEGGDVSASDRAAAVVPNLLEAALDDVVTRFRVLSRGLALAATNVVAFAGDAPTNLPYLPSTDDEPGGLVGLTRAVFADPDVLPNAFSILAHSLLHSPEFSVTPFPAPPPDQRTSLFFNSGITALTALAFLIPPPLGPSGLSSDPPTYRSGLADRLPYALGIAVNEFLSLLPVPELPGDEAQLAAARRAVDADPLVGVPDHDPPADAAEAFDSIVEGFGITGLRAAVAFLGIPGSAIALAEALAIDDPQERELAVSEVVIDAVHAPLWVADPALWTLRDVLPVGLGGGDGEGSFFSEFRDGFLIDARDDFTETIIGALRLPQQTASIGRIAPTEPIARDGFSLESGITALVDISRGLGESGALFARQLGLAPAVVAEIFRQVSNDDLGPDEAVRRLLAAPLRALVGGPGPTGDTEIDAAFTPGALGPAADAVRDNSPAPWGDDTKDPEDDGGYAGVDKAVTQAGTGVADAIDPREQAATGTGEADKPKSGSWIRKTAVPEPDAEAERQKATTPGSRRPRPVRDAVNGVRKGVRDIRQGIRDVRQGVRDALGAEKRTKSGNGGGAEQKGTEQN